MNKNILDPGPSFHGTKRKTGHWRPSRTFALLQLTGQKIVYFTATLEAANSGAELAKFNAKERIYIVEPLGDFENDPNLTEKTFPGNPKRSYRSTSPLKIIAELSSWERHSDEEKNHMLTSLKKLSEQEKNVIYD